MFKIVDRTFTETWHSMFLGWLLDPNGSHGLKDFSLKRLLIALTDPTLQGSNSLDKSTLSRIALLGNLNNASVIPNEDNQKEFSMKNVVKNVVKVVKFDVYISEITCTNERDTVILIEQKVHAKVNKDQCRKYADWLYQAYPNKNKLLLLLAPSDRLEANIEETTGDNRWNAIDYQTLHDEILIPIVKSPDISEIALPLVTQYIDTLRIPSKGRKLAVTEEEKELALELFEKHKDAFEAIFSVLKDTGEIESSSTDKILKVKITDKEIDGKSVRIFYENALKYLIDEKIIDDSMLPYATGTKRYLISKEPKHQEGNAFRVPIEYHGYYMEAHKSKASAVNDLVRFLTSIKVKIESTFDT